MVKKNNTKQSLFVLEFFSLASFSLILSVCCTQIIVLSEVYMNHEQA